MVTVVVVVTFVKTILIPVPSENAPSIVVVEPSVPVTLEVVLSVPSTVAFIDGLSGESGSSSHPVKANEKRATNRAGKEFT